MGLSFFSFFPSIFANFRTLVQESMIPTQITLGIDEATMAEILLLDWQDGHKGAITLRTLRDRCPCAGCQGETVLLRTFAPAPAPELPGKYKLVGANQVGSYALGISWADGHQTGIYTWETLRGLCECPECLAARSGSTA